MIAALQPRQRVDRKEEPGKADRQQHRAGDVEALVAAGADALWQAAQEEEAGQRDRRAEPEHAGPAPPRHQRPADQGPTAEPTANISVKMPSAWLRRASG